MVGAWILFNVKRKPMKAFSKEATCLLKDSSGYSKTLQGNREEAER